MSFVRRGRPSYLANSRQKKKKNTIRKLPAWDDSLTDLSVYRANAADLEYRKAVHQSKHLPSIKFERQKKSAQKDEIISTLGKLNPKQLAIMKEILFNQDELQSVLNYSDRLMDKVKDVCGDNPKRYQAFPSVTSAPGSDAEALFKNNLPTEFPEYQSRLDLLSNQVMSSVALNDDQQSQDEVSSATSTYTSQIDMERFRRLLAAEEENLKNACATPKHQDILAKIQADSESDLTEGNATTPEASIFGGLNSAANDTKKVNRVRKVIAEDPAPSATQIVLDGTVPATLSLSDLKKVLEELQSEMDLYEQNTGKMTAEKEHRETFSGYTMALLNSVIKLSRYLRETEEKLQTEKNARELLAGEVSDLKIIVDALTSDLLETQETNQNLERELWSYQQKMDQEICALKEHAGLPLRDSCEVDNILPTSVPLPPPSSSMSSAVTHPTTTVHPPPQSFIPLSFPQNTDAYRMEASNIIRKTKSLEAESSQHISSSVLNVPAFRPAFQLSPPVQKTRVFTSGQNGTERQVSLVGIDALALSSPSNICQPAASQKIPSLPDSAIQSIPKQPSTDIVIPGPVLLDQSRNASLSVLDDSAQIVTMNSLCDDVGNSQLPSEPTKELGNGANSDLGIEDMSRSFMLSQIEELNRQHEEAEKVLKMLLQSDIKFGTEVISDIASQKISSESLQQFHSDQPDLEQQDAHPSPGISPVPNFTQDHATSPQSLEFSIAT